MYSALLLISILTTNKRRPNFFSMLPSQVSNKDDRRGEMHVTPSMPCHPSLPFDTTMMIVYIALKTNTSMCVCVCFLPIYSGRQQVRWMYQLGSHRRKVTLGFSSTFLLRCMPLFFSREGFSRSSRSSTVKSNFVYFRFNRSPLFSRDSVRNRPSSPSWCT